MPPTKNVKDIYFTNSSAFLLQHHLGGIEAYSRRELVEFYLL
jgi:hypothetical protein